MFSSKKKKKVCFFFHGLSWKRVKVFCFGEIDNKKSNCLKHLFYGAISPSCGVLGYCFQNFPNMNINYVLMLGKDSTRSVFDNFCKWAVE